MNIAQLMGIKVPVPKVFAKAVPLDAADPVLLYGLELEIEFTDGDDWLVPGMKGETDGSLRNSGFEYITVPMTYYNTAHCLQTFFNRAKVTDRNYSERCSIHVHTNCGDLTTEQLTSLLLLYQTFERVLFNFIGHDRDKNIFCVPWSQTTLHYSIADRLVKGDTSALRQWQKYTAVNLLPLQTQGTIEWRHMHGHGNLELILTWMNIIGNMYRVARTGTLTNIKQEILDLNTNSQYRVFMSNVFREYFPALMASSTEEDIEDGVLQTKYSLLEHQPPKKRTLPGFAMPAHLQELVDRAAMDGLFREPAPRFVPRPLDAFPEPELTDEQMDAMQAAYDEEEAREEPIIEEDM